MKRFLVTAGPTREYIDSVRFVTNSSSGRTGFAIAAEAHRRGHETVLVHGPTPFAPPPGPQSIPIVSAVDMAGVVAEKLAETDVLIGTAAVCDWRPAKAAPVKLSKEEGAPEIKWIKNPDIMALAGSSKGNRLHIGFALEDPFDAQRGFAKMRAKNMDYIVVNGVRNLAAAEGTYLLLSDRSKRFWRFESLKKEDLASLLVTLAADGEAALTAKGIISFGDSSAELL